MPFCSAPVINTLFPCSFGWKLNIIKLNCTFRMKIHKYEGLKYERFFKILHILFENICPVSFWSTPNHNLITPPITFLCSVSVTLLEWIHISLSLSLKKKKKTHLNKPAEMQAQTFFFFFLSVPYSCSGREQHKRKSRVLFIKPSLAATQFHAVCTLPLGCPGRMKHASLLIAPV